MKLVLLCPELCECQGREGLEWVAEEVKGILERQAVALGLGLKERDLYSKGKGVRLEDPAEEGLPIVRFRSTLRSL